MKHIIPALTIILLSSALAHADEASPNFEHCFPAKGMVKMKNNLAKIPKKNLGYLVQSSAAEFNVRDSYGLPQGFVYRQGGEDTDIPIAPDGTIDNILSVPGLSKTGEYCIIDPARGAAKLENPDVETSLGFSMNVEVTFPRQDIYTMEQLKRGLKDGRPVYKKMLGAMGFMVPKLTHVSVSYDPKNASPKIEAIKDGEVVEGLTLEPFGKIWVLEIAQLEALGADGLRISDDFSVMEPGVSIEKMKKFGFVAEEDEQVEDEAQ